MWQNKQIVIPKKKRAKDEPPMIDRKGQGSPSPSIKYRKQTQYKSMYFIGGGIKGLDKLNILICQYNMRSMPQDGPQVSKMQN